jgi:hypothetical protein
MPNRKSLVAPALTVNDRPPNIGIVVTPDKKLGRFRACLEQERALLCVSRQPFLDSARKLLDRGHDPRTILIMRHARSDDVALSGLVRCCGKTDSGRTQRHRLRKMETVSSLGGLGKDRESRRGAIRAPVDDSASQERTAE